MSLTIAMQSAISSMSANQLALQVTSNNVSNANTVGFTKKTVDLETRILNGLGAGVIPGNITRTVDEHLQRELWIQSADSGQYNALDFYYQRMQSLFGTVSNDSSFVTTMTDFSAAMQALAVNPEGVSQRSDAVTSAQSLVDQLTSMGRQLQDLRRQADQEISTSIDDINAQLTKIDELNRNISRNTALHLPTGDFEDQRDQAIGKIAQQMDISYYKRDNGEVVIFTKSGRTLLDRDPRLLSHASVSNLTAGVTHADGGIPGIMLDGSDITNDIASGKIGGLIDVRDQRIPDLAGELDRLTATLRDQINALNNQGTAFPAPNSLTGTHDFVAGDTLVAGGNLRIAVVDGAGKYVDDGGGNPAYGDIDLSALTAAVGGTLTVQNVIDAVNGGVIAGFPGIAGVTASLASGHLVIRANNPAYGVVVDGTDVDGSLGINGGVDATGVTLGGDITAFPAPTVTLKTNGISQAAGDALQAILTNGDLVLGVQTTAGAPGALQLGPDTRLAFGAVGGGAGSSLGAAVSTASGDIAGGGTVEVSIDSDNDGFGDTVIGTITFGAATLAGATAGGSQGSLSITGIDINRDTHVAVGGSTQSFGQYFGLNDLFTTGTNYDSYSTVPQDSGTTPVGSAGTLSFSGPFGATTVNYIANDSLQDVAASINANATLAGQNITADVFTEGTKVRLRIVDNDGNNFTLTDSGTFLSTFGVGTNTTGNLETIQVRQAVADNPALLSRGVLDTTTAPAIGSAAITAGDNTAVQLMANKFSEQLSFPTAGGLAPTTTTLLGYGSVILSLNAVEAANVSNTQVFKQNLVQDLQNRFDSSSGVNIDEELANMIVFQNAYTASARVIKTISEMFDTLTNLV
ncbi:MAG: flagellar hook-associated protein FlgK [Alphaproteobacteria bacterium]